MVNSDERMKKNVEYPWNLLVFETSLFFLLVDVFELCSVQIHIIQNYFPDMKMALPFYPVAKPFLQGKMQGGRSYGNEHGQFTRTHKKNGIS